MEYYDSIKDPIKMYFMEKITLTVSNTRALDMLIEINEKEKKGENAKGGDGNNAEEERDSAPYLIEDELLPPKPKNMKSHKKRRLSKKSKF